MQSREAYSPMSAALLILCHLSTKLLGLDRTVVMFRWLGHRMAIRRLEARPTDRIAEGALRGLDSLPMAIECLDQAIAVWFALNRHGHPASLKIGMRLSPLSGHAWVTCGEEIFVYTPGLEDFTVVAAYAPWGGTS